MKKTLTTVLALAGFASVGVISPATALASSFYPTSISVNGTTTSTPEHTVANDGTTQTSFLPIWYIDEALSRLGVTATWNGVIGVLNLEVPSTVQVDLTNLPSHQNTSPSLMAIAINGTVVEYAPRLSLHDPANGVMTTYAPIYYLETTLNRIGITSGWDGTNWTMTSSASTTTSGNGSSGGTSNGGGTTSTNSNQATKLDAAKTFAAVLGIAPDNSGTNPYDDVSSSDWGVVNALAEHGYFTADSSTHFGSSDAITAQTVDHAYQLYLGIPDSHMAWNAGGNTLAWGTAIKLNSGVPTSGDLTPANLQQMSSNLTNLNRGYSKNSDGSLQLWFKPYDAYVPFYQNFAQNNQTPPWGDSSLVSSTLAHDIELTDQASIKQSGSYIIWKISGVPLLSSSNHVMVSVQSLFNSNNNYTGFNFNGGSTWTKATGYYGYDSTDPSNGGRSPANSFVWVKAEDHSEYSIAYNDGKYYPDYTDVAADPTSDGVPKIVYSR